MNICFFSNLIGEEGPQLNSSRLNKKWAGFTGQARISGFKGSGVRVQG
jgi:hypothetical protein